MKPIAFLSMDSHAGFYVYDELLVAPFLDAGIRVETVSWRDEAVCWQDYQAVIIRSCWDYQQDVAAFLACLRRIEGSGAVLLNGLSLVQWNINKTYLQQLAASDIPTIAALYQPGFYPEVVSRCFAAFGCEQLVIKPQISANADHTHRLTPQDLIARRQELQSTLGQTPLMVQPYLSSIESEGEVSLFYFGGDYSHAIRKRPKADDFRVQEEHGGQLSLYHPDRALLALADRTLMALPDAPLYARLDYVFEHGQPLVMEVELIEPSLYFNMDEGAAGRFVEATLKALA